MADHLHPAELRDAHHTSQPIAVRVARMVAAAFGTWQFGSLYLVLTCVWVLWGTFLRGPDPFPFILYTMLVSVLAILMSNLILLAGNYQEQLDRVHRENAYHQTDEILTLQREQMDTLAELRALKDQLTRKDSSHD